MQQSEYKNILKPVDPSTDKPIEPAHEFKLTLEPDDFTEEKYNLFAHYQFTVHKEPSWKVSKSGFKGFLCSGMARSTFTGDRKERQIGSFHSCYRIDGRLVAMGVLDLTPNCVSSVYLIYHEDFNAWNFGKLSAMHEIAFALEAGYRYYYMGYYIHSCIKMKYKRKFRRTFVLGKI